jgi:outer membrane biosynthesis protein TonB
MSWSRCISPQALLLIAPTLLLGAGDAFAKNTVTKNTLAKDTDGKTRREEVSRFIQAHSGQISHCYEAALLRRPDLGGKIIVNFTIGKSGKPTNVVAELPQFDEPALLQCIRTMVQGWRFKPAHDEMKVTYPFVICANGF